MDWVYHEQANNVATRELRMAMAQQIYYRSNRYLKGNNVDLLQNNSNKKLLPIKGGQTKVIRRHYKYKIRYNFWNRHIFAKKFLKKQKMRI